MTSIPFISLDERSTVPVYRRIYDGIRNSILNGEFKAGLRLPASRVMAEELGVSRMTVMSAYEQLFAEGYLEGRPGSGTYVASRLPEEFLHLRSIPKAGDPPDLSTRKIKLSAYGDHLRERSSSIHRHHGSTDFAPFQHGLTAIDQFPFELWSKIIQRHYKYRNRETLGYGDPGGLRVLREAIADHLRSARGVICEPEQVLVTNGTQQALNLISRILLGSGDNVWMEDPGYMGAKDILGSSGAKIVPVPVDQNGIDIERAPERNGVRLAYVTPSHQFPMGGTMSLNRRLKLLEWARDNEAWIVEDDYDSEFRFAGKPLASLQGLDRDRRVIYVGTFGKTIYPSLRLGCAVVPPDLAEIFTSARALTDLHSPLIDQSVLAEFIAEGHFTRHIRRMRKLYAERQQILIEEIEKHLPGLIEVKKADSGMHLVGRLPKGIDDKAVSVKLKERGVLAAPLSGYFINPPESGGLLLGYTAFDRRQIRAGVKVLRTALSELT